MAGKVKIWVIIWFSALSFLLCMDSMAQQAIRNEVVKTVVIDAGHGGKDGGSESGEVKEKDIVLPVALRLGALIRENYPSVKVIYTRDRDVFIPLDERARIANRAKADLFISIHANSVKGNSSSATGTETFIMGTKMNEENMAVAMRENSVIAYEADYSTRYDGYDPNSSESFIVFQMMQYSFREQSLMMARAVEDQYRGNTPLKSRGVKEAGFLVLHMTSMPSILTELGFLSNSSDLKNLTSEAGQKIYARSLFNAFSRYKNLTDGGGKLIVLDDADPADKPVKGKQEPQAANADPAQTADLSALQSSQGIVFAVQLMASPSKVKMNNPAFGAYRGQVYEKKIGSYYKYFTGNCTSHDEAMQLQAQVRKSVPGAFLVAFRDGNVIPVTEARKLVKN